MSSRALYKTNQYLFLTMSSYTNTRSIPTTSTETTTTSTSILPYGKKTDVYTTIANTIKDLLVNFYDKHDKEDEKFKEAIADQYIKFYKNSEK